MSATDCEFCPVLAEMLKNRRAVGRGGKRFDGLGALSTKNNLLILRNLHKQLRAKRTMEIGLAFGGSCLVFAQTHRDLGTAPSKQHAALDPYQNQVWDDAGLEALERAGLSAFVDFRPRFSSTELPRMLEEGLQFDLAYIDGSHVFEDVFVDAYFVVRILVEGGVVAFDDCSNPQVHKVVRFIRTNLKASLKELDLSSFRDDQGKSFKYRLARIAGRTQMAAFRRVGTVSRPWDVPFANF